MDIYHEIVKLHSVLRSKLWQRAATRSNSGRKSHRGCVKHPGCRRKRKVDHCKQPRLVALLHGLAWHGLGVSEADGIKLCLRVLGNRGEVHHGSLRLVSTVSQRFVGLSIKFHAQQNPTGCWRQAMGAMNLMPSSRSSSQWFTTRKSSAELTWTNQWQCCIENTWKLGNYITSKAPASLARSREEPLPVLLYSVIHCKSQRCQLSTLKKHVCPTWRHLHSGISALATITLLPRQTCHQDSAVENLPTIVYLNGGSQKG